ncbi:MAG TPA: Hsp20/alpha crystallin family protein [Chitinophagaceae bacterium]|nr:Hsp20/alpha crystallin family protein [Chitinophagaceae bacterium]
MEKAIAKPRSSWPTLFDSSWMDKFFNAPLDDFFTLGKVMNVPAVNVSENDKEFVLTVAVPGLDKKDIKVEAYDDLLTISAEKEKEEKEEKNGRYNRREYNYSSWSRSFTLPENSDSTKIDAHCKDGELKISIPKKQVSISQKAKAIPVS